MPIPVTIKEILLFPLNDQRRWNFFKLAAVFLAAWYFLPGIFVPGKWRIKIVNWVDIFCHEGGHIIFGITGIDFWNAFGGSFMQLFFPVAFVWYFLLNQQRFSAALVLFWVADVWCYISWYAGTARKSGIVGMSLFGWEGLHDFFVMFYTLGILRFDGVVSVFFKIIAIVIGLIALGYSDPDPMLGEELASSF